MGNINHLWGSEKTNTRGKILEQILDKFKLLCLNLKEETYYRAHDGYKSIINLTLSKNNSSRNYFDQEI